jgi:hypothetical protein
VNTSERARVAGELARRPPPEIASLLAAVRVPTGFVRVSLTFLRLAAAPGRVVTFPPARLVEWLRATIDRQSTDFAGADVQYYLELDPKIDDAYFESSAFPEASKQLAAIAKRLGLASHFKLFSYAAQNDMCPPEHRETEIP